MERERWRLLYHDLRAVAKDFSPKYVQIPQHDPQAPRTHQRLQHQQEIKLHDLFTGLFQITPP